MSVPLQKMVRLIKELQKSKGLKQASEQAADTGLAAPVATPSRTAAPAPKPKPDPEAIPVEGQLVDETPSQVIEPESPLAPKPVEETLKPATLGEAEKVARASGKSIPEPEVVNTNFDRIESEEDIIAMLDETAAQSEKKGKGPTDPTTLEQQGIDADIELQDARKFLKSVLNHDPEKQGIMLPRKIIAARNLMVEMGDKLYKDAARINANEMHVGDADLFQFRMNVSKFRAIQEVVTDQTRLAGQLLGSFRWIAKNDGILRNVQAKQLLEDMGGSAATKDLARLISEQGLDAKRLNKIVRDGWGTKFVKTVDQIRYNMMLSGFATQGRNLTGNLAMLAMRPIETAAKAAVGHVRAAGRKVTGKPTKHGLTTMNERAYFTELVGQVAALPQGILEGFNLAFRALKDPAFQIGAGGKINIIDHRRSFRDIRPISEWADKNIMARGLVEMGDLMLFNLGGRMLNAGDLFFKAINYRVADMGTKIRIAKNEGHTGEAFIDRVSELSSKPVAQDLFDQNIETMGVFTLTNELGTAGKAGQQVINAIPALRIAVPFYRTLVNITNMTADRVAPFNIMKFATPKGRKIMQEGGAEADDMIGRMMLWTSFGFVIADQVQKGNITGTGAFVNEGTMANWERSGHMRSAVWMGDGYKPLRGSAPLGSVVGYYASLAEAYYLYMDDPEAVENLWLGSAVLLSESIMQETFARGMYEWMDAMFDPKEHKLERLMKSTVGQFNPRWLGQFTGWTDEHRRFTNTGGPMDDIVAGFQAKVPFMSNDLMPMRTFFGEKAGPPASPTDVFPWRATQKQKFSFAELIENGVHLPYRPPEIMKLSGEDFDLRTIEDPDGPMVAYDHYWRILGEERLDAVYEATSESEYIEAEIGKGGTSLDTNRGDILNRAMTVARNEALLRMIDRYAGTQFALLAEGELANPTPEVVPLPPHLKRYRREQAEEYEKLKAERKPQGETGVHF